MKSQVILILIALSSIIVSAQNPEWRYLGNGDKVNVTIESSDAYYIGTESGLLELNKLTGNIVRTDRSNSNIYGSSIRGLAINGNGSLLVASLSNGDYDGVTIHTDQGIKRIVNNSGPMVTGLDGSVYMISMNGFYHFIGENYTVDTLMGYEIPGAITINPVNGDVWFTTYTFGQYYVYKYDGNSTTKYDFNNGLPFENPVRQPITISKKGEVYVSTYNGIYKESNGNWTNVKPVNNNEVISAIAFDNNDVLYACYQSESEAVITVIKLENNQWISAFQGPVVSYFGYTIKDMSFSKLNNNLILSTYGYGVWIHNNNGWEKLKSQAELAEVRITQLKYVDDNMWILMGPVNAYDSVAILRFDGKDYFDGTDGLPDTVTDAYLKILGKDAEGKVWARTQYQLYSLNNNKWVADIITGIPNFNPAYIDAIAGSSDGRTVLYHNSEAYIKTSGTWSKMPGAPISTYLTNLLWDAQNRLFVSFYDGWGFYDGSWHVYNLNPLINFKFEEAPNHDVYIFTGYQVLKVASNSNVPKTVSIPSGDWFSMTIDNKGWIWLASAEMITYFNGFNWISFDRSEPGYIGGSILNIEADKNDNIWIATYENGLEIFNPSGIVTSTNSTTTTLNELIVYPNPTKGNLNIRSGENTDVSVDLYDLTGRKLYGWSNIYTGSQIYFPENITAGTYIIKERGGINKSPKLISLIRD